MGITPILSSRFLGVGFIPVKVKKDKPMDNENQAPVIPSGTEPIGNDGTITSRDTVGQAHQNSPTQVQSESVGSLNAQQPGEVQASSIETTFAELAAKKGWQSPEDMAKAYAHLESHNTKVEMSMAELANARETEEQELPQESSNESVGPVESHDEALRVVQNIVKQQTKPLQDQIALMNLFNKSPDAKNYATQMAKVVKDNPGVSWEVAYKAAKFDDVSKQANVQGTQEAQDMQQLKQAAITGVAKPTPRDTRSVESLVEDKSIPLSEIRKMILEKERFSQ